MMDITETIEGMKNALGDRLNTRTAYGEPIEIDGVTVIPVARVFLGFGAGGGVGEAEHSTNGGEATAPVGGGGGGGGLVQPLGFIEIDTTGARWVPLEPSRAELGLRALMLVAIMLPLRRAARPAGPRPAASDRPGDRGPHLATRPEGVRRHALRPVRIRRQSCPTSTAQ